MTEYGMHEAKTQLSKLVADAIAGEEIVITRDGVPAVRLVPVSPKKKTGRKEGGFTFTLPDDFDAPMGPEFWGPDWKLFVDPEHWHLFEDSADDAEGPDGGETTGGI